MTIRAVEHHRIHARVGEHFRMLAQDPRVRGPVITEQGLAPETDLVIIEDPLVGILRRVDLIG